MNKCCRCGKPLTDENRSDEHIIPNAIGGILIDKNIYCKTCNNKYGAKEDKAFTDIFNALMAELNIRRSRKSEGSPYTGLYFDIEKNSLYKVTCKNKKIVRAFDACDNYIKDFDKNKKPQFLDFKIDNLAFKTGFAKIAFNYAVHCGIEPKQMDLLFDTKICKLSDKIALIPFIPLTMFDAFMEGLEDQELYHALRIFNIENCLFVYIELFSTFQYYVLLSENYTGNEIDETYCSLIEKRAEDTEEDKKLFTPDSYKDIPILLGQYNISYSEVEEKMRKKYGHSDVSKQMFDEIANMILEKRRSKSYEVSYAEQMSKKFQSLGLLTLIDSMKELEKDDPQALLRFSLDLREFTTGEDEVNLTRYKKLLPVSGKEYSYVPYPLACVELCKKNFDVARFYGHWKFHMLEKPFSNKSRRAEEE